MPRVITRRVSRLMVFSYLSISISDFYAYWVLRGGPAMTCRVMPLRQVSGYLTGKLEPGCLPEEVTDQLRL